MAESETPQSTDCDFALLSEFAREIAEIATSQLDYALEGQRRGIKVYESLKNLNEVIGTQYGDRVLFELVQNGHDAHVATAAEGAGEIAVRLLISADDRGELLVANRGRSFTRSNLDAVINIGTSDKRIGEGIGNKGLGFRSVEALTDDVRISAASCFTSCPSRACAKRAADGCREQRVAQTCSTTSALSRGKGRSRARIAGPRHSGG